MWELDGDVGQKCTAHFATCENCLDPPHFTFFCSGCMAAPETPSSKSTRDLERKDVPEFAFVRLEVNGTISMDRDATTTTEALGDWMLLCQLKLVIDAGLGYFETYCDGRRQRGGHELNRWAGTDQRGGPIYGPILLLGDSESGKLSSKECGKVMSRLISSTE